MIKTTIQTIPKEVSKEFPVLLKSLTTDCVVLAHECDKTGSFSGTVVNSGDNAEVGEYSIFWKRSAFHIFSGEVKLKQ